jgi:AraC-like DNA-binding protein
MTNNMPNHYIRERFPHARIRLSQRFSYITLENAILPLPPLGGQSVISASSAFDYRAIADDFSSSLETVLLSYLAEEDLTIEFAAGLCATSKRSLQRRLTKMGTNYSELLSNARVEYASRLLQVPAMTVTEVSNRLRYSDVAHFVRAFRRMAGVNPGVYRQQSIQ